MYTNRLYYRNSHGRVMAGARVGPGVASVYLVGVLAVVLLVAAGVVYRLSASQLNQVLNSAVRLPVPLTAIPESLAGWAGRELSIPETVQEYMRDNFADDWVSRRYVNDSAGMWADLYVVYCASRPGSLVGHQPLVCYPGNGWIHDHSTESHIVSTAGRRIKCLLHHFHKPAPTYQETIVLNFYVLDGQISVRESEFSSLFDRLPNLENNPARYVAQVQISSALEHSVRSAASDFVDMLLAFLPDENGQVSAHEYAPTVVGAADAQ